MKRLVSCLLCFVFVFCFTSCDERDGLTGGKKLVAVEYGSANSEAGEYYSSDGFTIVTYNSSSDVVLAVENGKVDYGILDDFQLKNYLNAGRKIKQKAVCEYAVDYCVYFNPENKVLQEEFNEAIGMLNDGGVLEEIKNNNLSSVALNKLESITSDKKLTMLCDPSFPDRVYISDENKVAGVDVDIAKAICNSLGYELEIVTADFDDLYAMLQDGDGDFLLSAAQVTENREEYCLASYPYLTVNYHLIEKE